MTTSTLDRLAARGAAPWYRMEQKGTTRSADVFLYDAIGGWFGLNVSQFVKDLAALDVDEISLRVNCPGGDVYGGIAIMNALRRHPATVTATVEGMAASAASYIVQAADEVIMGRGAEMMIHDAWGVAIGSADDMDKARQDLDRLSDTIAGLYADAAGGTTQDWRALMRAETWFTADEAVAAGLADRADGAEPADQTAAAALFDLSIFAHAGRAAAPSPVIPAAAHRRARPSAVALAASTPPAPRADFPHQEGAGRMADIHQGLRDRLGIPADAVLDDDGLLAAVDEALAERADPAPTTAQRSAATEGTVLVDAVALDELRADAAAGRQARQQQLSDRRVAAVDAAVRDGRIPPSRRQHWLTLLEADEGAAATLDELPKGTVPLKPAGFTGGVTESSDDDALYALAWGASEKKEA